ncbi:hypothetical protein RB195_010901 [Necator americanus]|uniref:Uncharacterized protein n=1 Tax=Necator americanus TaxID=51031 RepID=A0ABR1D160_NECAM
MSSGHDLYPYALPLILCRCFYSNRREHWTEGVTGSDSVAKLLFSRTTWTTSQAPQELKVAGSSSVRRGGAAADEDKTESAPSVATARTTKNDLSHIGRFLLRRSGDAYARMKKANLSLLFLYG